MNRDKHSNERNEAKTAEQQHEKKTMLYDESERLAHRPMSEKARIRLTTFRMGGI